MGETLFSTILQSPCMGRDDGPESQRPFLQASTFPHRVVVQVTGRQPASDPQDI